MNMYSPKYAKSSPVGIPMYPLYGYDNTEELNQDVAYWKDMMPDCVRIIQKEVEEECDKLEYDGSCMFDAYPDKNHLNTIIDTICERIDGMDANTFTVKAMQRQPSPPPFRPPFGPCGPNGNCPPPPRPGYRPDGQPDWRRTLITALLYNEMLHRRRRYRSHKQWF